MMIAVHFDPSPELKFGLKVLTRSVLLKVLNLHSYKKKAEELPLISFIHLFTANIEKLTKRNARTSSVCWKHQDELTQMIIKHNGGEAVPPNSSVTQTYVAHLIWDKLSSTYGSNHPRAGPLNSAGGSSISPERHLNSVSIARWTEFTETKHCGVLFRTQPLGGAAPFYSKEKSLFQSIIIGLIVGESFTPKNLRNCWQNTDDGSEQQTTTGSRMYSFSARPDYSFPASERRTRSLCN